MGLKGWEVVLLNGFAFWSGNTGEEGSEQLSVGLIKDRVHAFRWDTYPCNQVLFTNKLVSVDLFTPPG